MIGALVVTHGQLSTELVGAAKKIVGEASHLEAVSIDWDDDAARGRAIIGQALKRVAGDDGAILLTDMFGGTPTNLSLSFLDPGRIEIITGVNLPMLIKFLNLRAEMSMKDVVAEIREKGQRAIQAASELLGRRAPKDGE